MNLVDIEKAFIDLDLVATKIVNGSYTTLNRNILCVRDSNDKIIDTKLQYQKCSYDGKTLALSLADFSSLEEMIEEMAKILLNEYEWQISSGLSDISLKMEWAHSLLDKYIHEQT